MAIKKILSKFKKQELDFSDVDTREKADELVAQGELMTLHILPLRFDGDDTDQNKMFVPCSVVEMKERYDDMIEGFLEEKKVAGYTCIPEYKGRSFVPSKIIVSASKKGKNVFFQTIDIW